MTMMEEAIKHGGDGGAVSQQFAPVLDGSFEVSKVLVRS